MGGKRRKKISVKTWQLFLIFILFLFVSATCLRFDHIKMTKLRDEVITADESGDIELLAEKLINLKNYTTSHIVVNIIEENGSNKIEFGTGVFYLEQSYLRDATEAMNAAAEMEINDSNPNGNIYAAVSAICRPRAIANGWRWNSPGYLSCFTEELAKYPTEALTDGKVSVVVPSTELYRKEYVSPIWAPSLSGFVVLVTALLGVVIFIRFLIWLCLEIALIVLKKP